MATPPPSNSPVNPQKTRTGLQRIWHAAGYSLAGLRAGWGETAFRQEAIAAMVLLPASLWLGRNWVLVWALLSRFHPQRQFWHDAWAGTRLVSVQPPPPKKG